MSIIDILFYTIMTGLLLACIGQFLLSQHWKRKAEGFHEEGRRTCEFIDRFRNEYSRDMKAKDDWIDHYTNLCSEKLKELRNAEKEKDRLMGENAGLMLKIRDANEKIEELKAKLNPPKAYEYIVEFQDGSKEGVIAETYNLIPDGVFPESRHVFYMGMNVVATCHEVRAVYRGERVQRQRSETMRRSRQ